MPANRSRLTRPPEAGSSLWIRCQQKPPQLHRLHSDGLARLAHHLISFFSRRLFETWQGAPRPDVLVDHALQCPLFAQDVLDGIAHRAFATFVRRNVMRLLQHFRPRVLDRNRQPAKPHHWQVEDIIADVAHLLRRQPFLLQNLIKGRCLVLLPLVDVLDLQIARAQRHGFGDALGDDARLQTTESRQRKTGAVVRAKTLGLDDLVAGDAEAAFVGHLFTLLVRIPPRPATRRGKQEDGALRHHTVHVEQHELDLLCALIRHAVILAAGPRVLSTEAQEGRRELAQKHTSLLVKTAVHQNRALNLAAARFMTQCVHRIDFWAGEGRNEIPVRTPDGYSRAKALELQPWNDCSRGATVLLVLGAKGSCHEALLNPALHGEADPEQGDGNESANLAPVYCGADHGQNQAGVDGMPYPAIWPGENELMSDLDRDRAAPVASEVSPGPDGKQKARGGHGDAEILNPGVGRHDAQSQPAVRHAVAEHGVKGSEVNDEIRNPGAEILPRLCRLGSDCPQQPNQKKGRPEISANAHSAHRHDPDRNTLQQEERFP